jgi:hypothetical protein
MGSVESDLASHESAQDRADRYSDALCDWITTDRVKAKLRDLISVQRVTTEDLMILAVSAIADAAPREMTGTAAAHDKGIELLTNRLAGLVLAELALDFARECDEIGTQNRADARGAA